MPQYKSQKQYRMPGYDYSLPGYYFVTVCVKSRQCLLSEVNNNEIELAEIGKIVRRFWLEIPDRFKNIGLDEWVIMPDHLHGIVVIDDYNKNTPRRVPTGIQSLTYNSLSSVINHFKGNVKRYCNKNGHEHFAWQPRFYDHVIRNEGSLLNVREYIRNNPMKWELGKDNIDNLYMRFKGSIELLLVRATVRTYSRGVFLQT